MITTKQQALDIILVQMRALPRTGLLNTEADALLCEALHWLGESELVAAYLKVKVPHE